MESKIGKINETLSGSGTSIDDLITERRECEKESKELEEKINKITYNEIVNCINEKVSLKSKSEKLTKQNEKVKKLEDRLKLVEQTHSELKNIYDKFAEKVRKELAKKSTEIFLKLADNETKKDIKAISIDSQYMLNVLNWAGHKMLKEISAGQRQIVSLSFILAIIHVAGNLEVPLFMDTPFGRLSGAHRDRLLSTIPQMASQWILLATDTEFTEVESNVLKQTGCWGRIYELEKKEEGVTNIVRREVNEFVPKR